MCIHVGSGGGGQKERERERWEWMLSLSLVKIFVALRTHQELALRFIEMTDAISLIQINLSLH